MDQDTRTAAEKLTQSDYDNVMIFQNPDYGPALIGVSIDNRAVYDYTKMLDVLRANGMTDEQAEEYLEFKMIHTLAYAGPAGPIIFHPLD